MKKRVAITGIGAITPLGIGIKENWEKIKNGEQAILQIEFPGGNFFPHTFCGTVNNFNPSDFISERKMIKLMNREAQLAVSATKLAIEDAGIDGYYSPYQQVCIWAQGSHPEDWKTLSRLLKIQSTRTVVFHIAGWGQRHFQIVIRSFPLKC